MATITQEISELSNTLSSVPEAGHRGIDTRTNFVTKQETYQDHQRDILQPEYNASITELNTMKDELNTFATQTNAVRDEVNTFKSDAETAKNIATNKALEASVSANSALGSSIVVNAYGNLDWAGFYISDGELVVDYFNSNDSTPSIVDGDFILTY